MRVGYWFAGKTTNKKHMKMLIFVHVRDISAHRQMDADVETQIYRDGILQLNVHLR